MRNTNILRRRVGTALAVTVVAVALTVIVIRLYVDASRLNRGLEERGGTESRVVIDRRRGPTQTIVTKSYVRGTLDRRTRGYRKNVEILDRMAAASPTSNRVPIILDRDASELRVTMSYCGEPLTSKNAPRDTVRQLQEIAHDLHVVGITWIDPALSNFVVDTDGKISIIDFGWRTYDRTDRCAFSNGPLDVRRVLRKLRT